MSAAPSGLVGYVLKRFPRLSETFVVNEVRAVERLGVPLRIYSLLSPEGGPVQPMTADVRGAVTYFPEPLLDRTAAVVRAHAACAAAAPANYVSALGAAVAWSIGSASPLAVWKHFARAGFIADDCRRRGVTRLHAHFAHGPATVAHFASIMTGIRFSFTTHAKDLYLSPHRALRRHAGAADFVATCTGHNVAYLRSVVDAADERKIRLIYHGIDLAPFRALAGARAAHRPPAVAPRLLTVGRLVRKKGMGDVIEACRILAARGLSFALDVVGGGPLGPELQAQAERVGLGEAICFHGPMAHGELLRLFASATAFVLAPYVTDDGDRDGIPNVLVEAMAAGVPVVSTAISGIPELIEDGRTGLLVPPRRPEAIADAVARILASPERADALAAAARETVERDFECWRNARALRDLLTGTPEAAPELRMLAGLAL